MSQQVVTRAKDSLLTQVEIPPASRAAAQVEPTPCVSLRNIAAPIQLVRCPLAPLASLRCLPLASHLLRRLSQYLERLLHEPCLRAHAPRQGRTARLLKLVCIDAKDPPDWG